MDKKEFRAMFNIKVDEAKSKYRSPAGDRKAELDNLKEKIISDVQQGFLRSIPEVINPSQGCKISSDWIRVEINNGYYIADVFFADKTMLECFFAELAEELTAMLNKAVQVDEQEPKNYKLRRFSVKV